MSTPLFERWRGTPGREATVRLLFVAGAVVLALLVGRLSTTMPEVAIIVSAAVMMMGITALQPGLIPLLCLPLLLVVLRVGGGGVNLSLSDFVLAAATLPALLMARRPFAPGLRAVLWASAFYQFTTLLTVVNNPYAANVVEWAHAGVMVAGGLIVGWAVGANGHGRTGVRLLVLTIAVLALITVIEGLMHYARGDFSPIYPSFPFSMHKNFAGTLCGLGAAMVYARPRWVGFSRVVSISLMSLMVAAVLATQSRQAVLGLVGAVFVLVLRSDTDRKRSKLTLLVLMPILVGVTTLVQDQLKSNNQFNSAQQRLSWFQDSLTIWNLDPWFGVGLRWWYTDRFPFKFQPPNAEIEVLTSAGAVGLLGFMVLMVVALRVSWKLDPVYGSLALAVLVSRLVQGQFDLYWTAVQSSLPFVVLGLCLGAESYARHSGTLSRAEGEESSAKHPVVS